ncbi:MAG: hypothetical protein P4L16_05285 [Chlamydiales bacterium]|nr:hypothetical protein [Chlamydiales bacterium]
MAKQTWDSIKEKGNEYAHSVKEKGADVLNQVQQNPTVQEMTTAAKNNPKEAILAILISLGFIFSFYWLGSLVVGLAAALYIPWNAKEIWAKVVHFYRTSGKFPSFMLGVAFLFLIVHTFWFILGGVIGLLVKLPFVKKDKEVR